MTSEARPVRDRAARVLGIYLLVGLCYAVGAATTFLWFNATGGSAVFFPPAGITLSALVLTSPRHWPVVLAAAASAEILVDVANDIELSASIGYALANTAEPLAGALLLRLLAPEPDLSRLSDLLAFFVCVALAPMVGATIGATNTALSLEGTDWWDFWYSWWTGDGLGMLVVGGMALTVIPALRQRSAETIVWRWAALVPLAVALTAVVFQYESVAVLFFAIGLLAAIALLMGTIGVAVTGFGMAFAVAFPTAYGHGFFETVGVDAETGLVYLQSALAFVIGGAFALAAAVTERDRTVRKLGAERVLLDRTELLHRMAAGTAAAVTTAEVGAIACAETRRALGARTALLIAAGEEGKPELAGEAGFGEDELDRLRERLDGLEIGALDEEGVWVGDSGADPMGVTERPAGDHSTSMLAALMRDDEVLGALAWEFASRRDLRPDAHALALAAASQCALALERVRVSETEHRFSRDIQSAMLPTVVDVPGVDVRAYYEPAERQLEVGGDWYDVTALGDGEVVITVGDVVGRGLTASVAMGQLRSAARALAQATEGPAEILTGLDRFAADTEAAMSSTVCSARLSVRDGKLRYAAAGHPPPLLVNGERFTVLEDGRSLPLCCADGPRREAEVRLGSDDILALYTDGLVESPQEMIDVGIARLGDALVTAGARSFDRIADVVVPEALAGRTSRDDLALVVLRLRS